MAKSYLLSERDRNTFASMVRWWSRNRQAKPFRRRPVYSGAGAAGSIYYAWIAENPHNDATILIDLAGPDGVRQTTGDQAGIEAQALIANGIRLDQAWPKLSQDQPVLVAKLSGTYYLIPPFNTAVSHTT